LLRDADAGTLLHRGEDAIAELQLVLRTLVVRLARIESGTEGDDREC